MENEQPVEVTVVTPEIVPEEPDSLAYHVGHLREGHESLRRDMEAHRAEVAELRGLTQTLIDELQTVEEVVQEIEAEDTSAEDAVAETAHVGDPIASAPERRRHWLVRGLVGH